MPRRKRRALSVRALAAQHIADISAGRGSVESAIGRDNGLNDRDRALLRALVSGALRWFHRLDWVTGELVGADRKIDPPLRALLHVGLFQILELRIPDHAAVSATVDAAAQLGFGRARGFINAALRRFQRERESLAEKGGRIWQHSHPQWLLEAIEADWHDDAEAIFAANNERAPQWLRVNLQRLTRADYLDQLAAAGLQAEAGTASAATVLLRTPSPAHDLPGYRDGLVSIQDAAAQLACGLMDLRPGLRVLDACAAPGGKTAHMLESCAALAELVAVDRDAKRLAHVEQELSRLGLAATLSEGDATRPTDWWDGQLFDRILLDAPCSATGVIRRHPEIKLRRSVDDVETVTRLQGELLTSLWPLLAPGGRLVYATCSVLTRENAAQIGRFMADRPTARCEPIDSPSHFRVPTGTAGMDGFYYACVNKSQVDQGPE